MADWLVTVFDEEENEIDSWFISDRTENEAEKEAAADIGRVFGAVDWCMSELHECWPQEGANGEEK